VPSEPDVVRVLREFKRALLAGEAEQVATLTLRWRDVERLLEESILLLAQELADLHATGMPATQGAVMRLERYQRLLAQVLDEIARYTAYAERLVTTGQREMAALGLDAAHAAIRASGVRGGFNVLPVSAVEAMVGLAGDGSPLFDVLRKRALSPDAVEGLTQALVRGTALGWNPRKTARAMRSGLAEGLQKALVIARSEQLRVYRHATVEGYRQSGVVSGFRRLATKDARTCMACLVSDGEVFRLEQEMDDHPCGRCTAVPIIIGMPPVQWQTGAEWFGGLAESTQRRMLGDRRYELWREGRFGLEQLRRTAHSDVWGDSPRVATVAELVAA
jgi:SPP1 gp7 family putative phage head morphogenesis protein